MLASTTSAYIPICLNIREFVVFYGEKLNEPSRICKEVWLKVFISIYFQNYWIIKILFVVFTSFNGISHLLIRNLQIQSDHALQQTLFVCESIQKQLIKLQCEFFNLLLSPTADKGQSNLLLRGCKLLLIILKVESVLFSNYLILITTTHIT